MTYAYKILVGKLDGNSSLEGPRRRCKNTIKIYFKKWDWEVWTGLIWLMIGTGNGLL
jgi:hypothetical protein